LRTYYANNHREHSISREGIEIQDNCWIGTGVRILDGVSIGSGSVIGAGSVVTKDIPSNSIAVGVPAKVIKPSKGGFA
jgi:acetyltransferase-like isoleucine patch superfamily enzyme